MSDSTKAGLSEKAYITRKAPANFPSARYFQVHFEFLQEQTQLIRRTQDALHMQMEQLEQRLSTIQPFLFNGDPQALTSKHPSSVSSPATRQAGLRAGRKNPTKD